MLLNAAKAAALDKLLMSPEYGYTLEQLMELAGLSCALAINQQYGYSDSSKRILIIAGPGNNGGDGLVCARHLKTMGWNPTVYYPNAEVNYTKNPFYGNLVQTLEAMYDIPVIKKVIEPKVFDGYTYGFDKVVDAIFGFSFKPPMKEGVYSEIIRTLVKNQGKFTLISVDSPSGWDVDKGPVDIDASVKLNPDMLISLTYPKNCSRFIKKEARHLCGGNFVSKKVAKTFDMKKLNYEVNSMVVDINRITKNNSYFSDL